MRMKKLLATAVTVVAILGTTVAPAFASVIFNGSPGQPTAMGSNSGSVQGQTHRSSIGTYNKVTHDGWKGGVI
jgi:hypothetical protein